MARCPSPTTHSHYAFSVLYSLLFFLLSQRVRAMSSLLVIFSLLPSLLWTLPDASGCSLTPTIKTLTIHGAVMLAISLPCPLEYLWCQNSVGTRWTSFPGAQLVLTEQSCWFDWIVYMEHLFLLTFATYHFWLQILESTSLASLPPALITHLSSSTMSGNCFLGVACSVSVSLSSWSLLLITEVMPFSPSWTQEPSGRDGGCAYVQQYELPLTMAGAATATAECHICQQQRLTVSDMKSFPSDQLVSC